MRTLARFAAALLAAAPLSAAAEDVTHIRRTDVDAAFAEGTPLLETGAYKVHASRREAAGMAEVHVRDTDLIYLLQGSATLVTGGSVVDGRTIAPDEIRGVRIDGGTPREVGPGDVVIVPHGTPHWFQAVKPPVLYYVVKVTEGAAQ
jgi:mannose-6-phosphate isomerase-like protein (cupin superfamily)